MDIKFSKELLRKAVLEYKPYAVVMMLSGGDDSLTAYEVAREIGVKPDFVMHGITGTGLKETTDFVVHYVRKKGDNLLIANAGKAYENYVLRKGFFGVGSKAHSFSYHLLKSTHFSATVSKYIRKRKRNRNVLFINGARRKESKRREKTMINPIKKDGSNIWVNIINEATKKDTISYLEGNSICRNPVSIKMCKSGECMCGTMQNNEMRVEAGYISPSWKRWIDSLENEVLKSHPWKWGAKIPSTFSMEKKGQLNLFRPMCVDCGE